MGEGWKSSLWSGEIRDPNNTTRFLITKKFSKTRSSSPTLGQGVNPFKSSLNSFLGRLGTRPVVKANQNRAISPCESLRVSKRGSAEIMSSLSSHRSPRFWASHSGQTGLGSVRIIFLKKPRSKSSLQYENQYGV